MKKSRTKPETVATTLRLPKTMWEQINHLAVDRHTSMSELVLEAISQYLKREGR